MNKDLTEYLISAAFAVGVLAVTYYMFGNWLITTITAQFDAIRP